MEKVPTKRLLKICTITWGVAAVIYSFIGALDYGNPQYNKFVDAVLLSAADPDSTVGAGKDKNLADEDKEAVKIGKVVRAKYDQGIDPKHLTELAREMQPFVEKKLELLAIKDVSAVFKTLPADLDTAKFIISLSTNRKWNSLINDDRDRTRLFQVLKGEKTGRGAVNSKDFFLLDKYIFILILQTLGFLIYLMNFYLSEAYENHVSYFRYIREHGVWYNLNWKNPLVWLMLLPSALPPLMVLSVIKISGKISSRNKGRKNTSKSYPQDLTGHSEEDTRKLAQKLQTSIGGGQR